MQKLPLNALEKYVYGVLSENTAQIKVYDFVPDEARYPFYSIGECSLTDWSSKRDYGSEVVYHVTAWSDAKGMKQVNDMSDTVISLFVNSPSALDYGFHIKGAELVGVDVNRHSSGEIRFADITIRFLISQD